MEHSINPEQRAKILHFLKAVPHLEFTEKGIYNICKRFQVAPDYLFSLIEQVKKGRKTAKNEPFNVLEL